jgi:hypothetical protein
MSMLDTALAMLKAGLCVLPAIPSQKRPALGGWKEYQSRLPTEHQVQTWFANADGICLICGSASGNLEMLDFDLGGEAFQAWYELVGEADTALLNRLVVEQSPSGGWHVVYRCQTAICGNMKLAQKKLAVDSSTMATIAGKTYKPRQDAEGHWYAILTLIETRGEGGLFLCAPTPGYELLQGDFTQVPILTAAERELLLEAAWSLNQHIPAPTFSPTSSAIPEESRPGDDFNERGDVRDVLRKHGWTLVRSSDNEYWRRPGKTSGWSATLKDKVFYVFSSSSAPFEPNQAYAPFSVFALLEHGGDFVAAASALRAAGFGDDTTTIPGVDLTGFNKGIQFSPISGIVPDSSETDDPEDDASDDQYPDIVDILPLELLRIPGFVSEIIDLCLETAPYPNQPMTFCGALALQAFLAGRKVRDPGDNRTNIYLLGLAYSSVGKDWIRKLNSKILFRIGLSSCLKDRLASGEGIQEAINSHPCLIFQSDEIDALLLSINRAKDARHEGIMSTLLSLYSSANSVFAMRPKADNPDPGAVDQPNLVLFGSAIPNHYYNALSERMLTNGFFARQIVIEAGKRQDGQEPGIIKVSQGVLDTAKWWADFCPGAGNLHNVHPEPAIVEHTPEAKQLIIENRLQAEAEYSAAEDRCDPVGTTVWGRVSEHTRKLALLYAISENHVSPLITKQAVEWASRFVMHQTRRMLFMAVGHVADNPFHADCLKVLQKLRAAPRQQLSHSKLLKRMKINAKYLRDLLVTLDQRGDITTLSAETTGRKGTVYQLTRG